MSEHAIVVSRVLSTIIAIFACLIIIFNYAKCYERYRAKSSEELEKVGVIIPFLGGLFGVWALYWSHNPVLWRFWWIPLVIDPGSIPMVVYLFIRNVREMRRNNIR